MSGMFSWSEFNQDISGWNVSNVGSFASMFSGVNNQDISNWNVSSNAYICLTMHSNQDLSGWCNTNIATKCSLHAVYETALVTIPNLPVKLSRWLLL